MFLARKCWLVQKHRLPNNLQCRFVTNENSSSISETRIISQTDVDQFSQLTGDFNPVHSANQPLEKRVIHGALLNGLVSGIIGTKLPGPGSIAVSQSFSFPNPCVVDVPIEIRVDLVSKRKLIDLKYECVQQGRLVFKGTARVVMQKATSSL